MGAAQPAAPRTNQRRRLPWWATQQRPPRKRERIEVATEEVAGRVAGLPAVYGPAGERKTKMYNGRVFILTRLVELLLRQGGWLKLPASDLAHECNTCLRTIRYALQEFRERRLIVTVETPNVQGGKGPLSIHLHPSIRPIFFPPRPEDVAPLNSTPPTGEGVTSGCAHAREGEAPRKRRPAARDLNNILGALRAPLTASLGDADRRVLVHVENSLQKPPYERWVPLYRDLLLQAVSLRMRPRLKAPGGWVRAELARAMQLAGERPPETWLQPRCSHRQLVGRCEHGCTVGVPPVKLMTEAEVVRMRLGAGADRLRATSPPAAVHQLRSSGDPPPRRPERGADGLSAVSGNDVARALGVGRRAMQELAERSRAELAADRAAEAERKVRGITGTRTRRESG